MPSGDSEQRRARQRGVLTATAGLLMANASGLWLLSTGVTSMTLRSWAFSVAATVLVQFLVWLVPRMGWDARIRWDPDYIYLPTLAAVLLFSIFVYVAPEARFLVLMGWLATLLFLIGVASFREVFLLGAAMTMAYFATLALLIRKGMPLVWPLEVALGVVFFAINVYAAVVLDRLRYSSRLARAHAVWNAAADGIVSLDSGGSIVSMNPAAEQMFERPTQDVLGRSMSSLLLDGRALDGRSTSSFLADGDLFDASGGAADEVLVEGRRWDGRSFPLSVRIARMRGARSQGYVLTLRDITERSREQRALVESEDRYRGLFNASRDAIFVCSSDASIVEINDSAIELFGYSSPDELIGVSSAQSLMWNAADAARLASLVGGGRSASDLELAFRKRTGERIDVLLTGGPIPAAKGEADEFRCSLRELTHVKRLEEQLASSQELDAVGRLAGGIAHDFNNLLTVINGHVGLLLRELGGESSAGSRLTEIKRAGERAAAVTRRLLAFSRQDLRQLKTLDLNELILGADAMLARTVGESVELVLALEPTLPRVRADAGQLDQVILNLVVNAREAMPHGGRLTVRTAEVVLDEADAAAELEAQPGRFVVLEVRDTGHGMDESIRAHVFEPFFTTQDQPHGRGLGLAMVHGIARQGGGFVRASSEKGRGSVFRVYLVPAEPARQIEKPAAGRMARTILIVEDDEPVRALLRDALERAGYAVLAASGPEQAGLLAPEGPSGVDLVLTSLAFPDRGGVRLVRRWLAERPSLKFIFMASDGTEGDQRDELVSGSALLAKPFDPDLLTTRVAQLLDSAPTLRAVPRPA